MDMQTEQAVWRRVKGPGSMTAEEAVLPERLEALLIQELATISFLRLLSGKMRGQASTALFQIVKKTENRTRELTAMHFLMTGRTLRIKTPPVSVPDSISDALRVACLRMKQTAKSYEGLSAEFANSAEDFSRYVRQTQEQAGTLLGLLRNQLPRLTGTQKNGFTVK